MAEVVVDIEADTPPAKKAKLETDDAKNTTNSIHKSDVCLSDFTMKKVLQANCTKKQVSVEGTFGGYDGSAILILEKQNFPNDEEVLKEFFDKDTMFQKLYSNNIYGNYECFPTKKYSGINAMVIHPATQKHIEKFEKKTLHLVDETYEIYQNITLPYIESNSFSITWVYNILEHKAEQDKIVYEDRNEETGFVIVHDLKWDGQTNTLKLIALPFQHLRSIRELNASHLPLLRNIRDAGTKAIMKKFNIPPSQLRIYFHYQPSYYYLHVHFAYLMADVAGIFVERAHLLSTVIRNIELMPDYYTKAVLSYVVFESNPLYNRFVEEGVLKHVKSESEPEAEKCHDTQNNAE